MIEIPNGNDNNTRSASLEEATTTYTCQPRYCYYCYVTTQKREKHDSPCLVYFPWRAMLITTVSLACLLSISGFFENLLRVSVVFAYLSSQDQTYVMKTGPKPIGGLLIPGILEVLQDAGCDLRTWTITVRVRYVLKRPQLRWETVHKYLEQMVQEQMVFRYEDPLGLVTYSKNPIMREKVLF